MTQMTIHRLELDAPVPEKSVGNLLDTIEVNEVAAGGMLDPVGLYTSINCMTTDTETALCPDATTAKSFPNSPTTIDGIRFAVYTGFKCKLIGLDMADVETRIKAVIDRKESYAVEKQLLQTRFTGLKGGAAATVVPSWGSGLPSAEVGLALLEQDAGEHYSGKVIIHAPRSVGSLLTGIRGTLDLEGSKLVTGLGNYFAAGAGYSPSNGPDAVPAVAPATWMYASGVVRASRGPLVIRNQFDQLSNTAFFLAERVYVVDVDCYLSAVKVNIA